MLLIGVAYIVVLPWLGYLLSVAALIAATTYFQGGSINRRSILVAISRSVSGCCSSGSSHPAPGGTMAVGDLIHLFLSTAIVPAAFGGVAWGILGGALPGISVHHDGAAPAVHLRHGLDRAVVLLASTYVGAEHGGSIPAILIGTPGTNAAAATVIDGYEMKRQGKAGEALGISLYSGFVGGLFGLLVLVLLTERLSTVALAFTPPAYFALGVLGLSVIASLSGDSLVKGLIAGIIGLMVATIGTDP
jgi:putative tricarboxylic transport membrane protein